MQPEQIIELLESNEGLNRKKGIEELYHLLIPQNKNKTSGSPFNHTKLWKHIRRRTWDADEADEIITNFFEYIMRRFNSSGKQILSTEDSKQEKKAPKIENLEAFAFWKCGLLITDYERKMGRQREREVVANLEDSILEGSDLSTKELEEHKQEEIVDCIKDKLKQFSKEKSPDGAAVIGMQLSGTPIIEIAKLRKKSISATKEYIRVSKIRAKSYLAPCDKINTYSKAIEKLRKN